MNDNSVISEWRGECRHPDDFVNTKNDGRFTCPHCKKELLDRNSHAPAYDTDPAAWDEALWKEIEDAGLWLPFLDECIRNAVMARFPDAIACQQDHVTARAKDYFYALAATPAQKAAALAKAIREGK